MQKRNSNETWPIGQKTKPMKHAGTSRGNINDIVVDLTTEFYYQLWSKKNQWQSALKNKK